MAATCVYVYSGDMDLPIFGNSNYKDIYNDVCLILDLFMELIFVTGYVIVVCKIFDMLV